MSSSSAQAESGTKARKAHPLFLVALVVVYPLISWWAITRGGTIGGTAMLATAVAQMCCYVMLLWFFGRSLFSRKQPVLTHLARLVHGEISLDVERYTRKLTLFWSAYFAFMVTVAVALALFVSTEAWLFFANVINLPLLISVFVTEYLYRIARFPQSPSLLDTIEAFKRYRSDVTGREARR